MCTIYTGNVVSKYQHYLYVRRNHFDFIDHDPSFIHRPSKQFNRLLLYQLFVPIIAHIGRYSPVLPAFFWCIAIPLLMFEFCNSFGLLQIHCCLSLALHFMLLLI